MDAATEILVRKHLAAIVATVPEAGYIKPAAQYFSGIEDFWATVDPTKDTQDEVEMSLIAGTWIYPVNFTDDATSGTCDGKPLMNFSYEFYLFVQYGLIRADESETPDVFDKKVLVQHNAFIAAWLGIKQEFQRKANIPGLTGYAKAETGPVVQIEDIASQAVCEFIPGAVGYAVRLRETVSLLES